MVFHETAFPRVGVCLGMLGLEGEASTFVGSSQTHEQKEQSTPTIYHEDHVDISCNSCIDSKGQDIDACADTQW